MQHACIRRETALSLLCVVLLREVLAAGLATAAAGAGGHNVISGGGDRAVLSAFCLGGGRVAGGAPGTLWSCVGRPHAAALTCSAFLLTSHSISRYAVALLRLSSRVARCTFVSSLFGGCGALLDGGGASMKLLDAGLEVVLLGDLHA